MTDIRLTALNPEDSTVVPVACNSSGELLVGNREPIGPDLNLEGDLSVGGSASVDGNVLSSNASVDKTCFAAYVNNASAGPNAGGLLISVNQYSGATPYAIKGERSDGTETFKVSASGSGSFSGGITAADNIAVTRTLGTSACYVGEQNGVATSYILADGSAQFASGNAGFTAEGYLWCTTRRGDTVVLDATSNGLATWANYTPPTRRSVIADKFSVIADKFKDGKPGVSQELPETQ